MAPGGRYLSPRFADRRTLDEKAGGDGNHQGVVAICASETKVRDERFLRELLKGLEQQGEAPFLLIRIPMAGEVSSLNVSVATGICRFEAVRQHSG